MAGSFASTRRVQQEQSSGGSLADAFDCRIERIVVPMATPQAHADSSFAPLRTQDLLRRESQIHLVGELAGAVALHKIMDDIVEN